MFLDKKMVPLYMVVTLINLALWLGRTAEENVWVFGLAKEKVEQSFEEKFGFKPIPPKHAEGNQIWERRNELKLAFLNQEVFQPAYSSQTELQAAAEDGKREWENAKKDISHRWAMVFRRK